MTQALANPTTPSSTAQSDDQGCVDSPACPATRRIEAPAPLSLWHLASLDAPTVAIVWVLAFAWAAHVSLPAWAPILLALVAYPVYVADRLLDVRSAVGSAQLQSLRQRHYFHWRHRRLFISFAALSAAAAACIIVIYMPIAARERNSILVAAGLAYFSSVHAGRAFPRFLSRLIACVLAKETVVAVIFTAACALPALSRVAPGTGQSALLLWPLALSITYFTLIAWLNCRSIEQWESCENSSHRNAASNFGTFPKAIGIGLTGVALAAILTPNHRIALLVASGAAAALLLALLDRIRDRLTPLALRAAADLVLLAPLPFLLR